MNKAKKQFMKRKSREREVQQKLMRRREAIRAEVRKVEADERKEAEARRAVNRTFTVGDRERKTPAEIREQLERNMRTLQAMEQEHNGLLKTREEYMRQLQEQQARQQAEAPSNWGGSAGVEFNPFHTDQDRIEYEKKVAEQNQPQPPTPVQEPQPQPVEKKD